MDKSIEFKLSVRPAGSDVSDDNWEKEAEVSIDKWKEACEHLHSYENTFENIKTVIKTDWFPMVQSFQNYSRAMKEFRQHYFSKENRTTSDYSFDPFQRQVSEIKIIVEFADDKLNHVQRVDHASQIVENYLFDIFLIMEITSPGLCNFHNAKLTSVKDKNSLGKKEVEINLSNINFDIWNKSVGVLTWQKPQVLDLNTVIYWFRHHRNNPSQVPASATERVFFALWFLARDDSSPTSIIWIFYALESLFCTNPGQNKSALILRLASLLELDDDELKQIKNKMTKLYDMRSAIVHGGMKIIHPSMNDRLDNSVETQSERLYSELQFGFSVLMTSIQKIILNGWLSPEFHEKVSVHGTSMYDSKIEH